MEKTEVFIMGKVSIQKPETALTLAGIAAALLIVYVIAQGNVWLASYRNNAALWDLSAADIVKITITNNAEELVFEKSETSGWELVSPQGIPCDKAIAEALPLTLASLKVEKEIAAAPFPDFALDTPVIIHAVAQTSAAAGHVHAAEAAPVQFTGTAYELLLGGKNSDGSSRYFSVNGKVYTMNADTAAALTLDSLNVRDKNVLKLNRSLRLADIAARISNIRVNGEKRPELSDTLSRLNADTFIGEIVFKTERTIEFEYSGEPRTLYLGALPPGGEYYYAKTPDSGVVFTVSRRGLE
jgi:hypothetical protein